MSFNEKSLEDLLGDSTYPDHKPLDYTQMNTTEGQIESLRDKYHARFDALKANYQGKTQKRLHKLDQIIKSTKELQDILGKTH